VRDNYVDLKRNDAELLLRHLRDLPETGAPRDLGPLVRSHFFEGLYECERYVEHRGESVSLETLSHHAALHLPDFERFNFAAQNFAVARAFADFLHVEVADDAIDEEQRRFRLREGLKTTEAFDQWLLRNDVSAAEFSDLMREVAKVRRLHHWLAMSREHRGSTKTILDQLRLDGRYEENAERAALEASRVRQRVEESGDPPLFADASTEELVLDHLRNTACAITMEYARWAEEAGFEHPIEFRNALARAKWNRDTAVRNEVDGSRDTA
jgi:hypothetical protein